MAEVKKARLFLRRGTDTDRKTTTLCQGELGYSTDAFRVFIGDGTTVGGKSIGMHTFVSAGAHFNTDLTEASGSGLAHFGDIAVFPGQNYTNAAGTTVTPSKSASTVLILTGANAATATSWVAINSGIPFGNIDVFDDDISGDKVHGGTISGPLTLSGGEINIGGVGPSENLVLSGTYLSAATLPTNDLVFPLGLTSGAQLTCVNSILDFGDTATTSTLGNAGGYVHANPTSVSNHISAYGVGTTAYVFSSTATQQASGTPTVYNNSTNGINVFTDYIKSGGAYATGSSTPLIPDNWSYSSGHSGKCGILEVAFDQAAFRNATNTSVDFTAIREFYFSVFMIHQDDSAQFVGHHNHCTDTNEILCWSGSGISGGKMKNVPAVHHITIPNTYNGSDTGTSQHALVLHLGLAATGNLAVVFTGLRVNTS